MNVTKGRPRRLKPTIRRLIYTRAITNPSIPREYLANELIKEIRRLRELPPSLETAKKMISHARNSDKPLDKPWNLGACVEYQDYFPPDSLSFLLKCQEQNKQFFDIVDGSRSKGFSIRIAIWMVRLRQIIQEYFKPSNFEEEIDILFNVSQAYSTAQLISESIREDHFDSTDLDDAVYSQQLESIFTYGFAGVRNTSSICESNCDSCKYFPLVKGKICQLKSIREKQEKLIKQIDSEEITQTKKGRNK